MAELWRQKPEEKLWRRRLVEGAMEVDGMELDAMLVEDLMSKLPALRTRLMTLDSTGDQLDALREIRKMWSDCDTPICIYGDIPKCLVTLVKVPDLPNELKVEALAALADLASSEKGALAVADLGALPLCVSLLQSPEEIREEAFRVLHGVHEKAGVF
eukprot:Skav207823  [mRNA]  locus=scaffold1099:8472:8945:- [translate_table: standard]